MFGLLTLTLSALAAEPPAAIEVSAEGVRYELVDDGVLELWDEETDALLERRFTPGAVGLFLADEQAWLVYQETRAAPVSQALSAHPAAPVASEPAAPAAPAEPAAIRVVRVDQGAVVIDAGRSAGLAAGDAVRFLGVEVVKAPSLDGASEETREEERVVATGRVSVLEDDRALVDLQRGGRVSVGDRMEADPGRSRYPAAPARLNGLGELGLAVRPLLALDNLGVAFINELWASWSFESPWYVAARLSPVGAGWSRDGNPLSVAALGVGGYDQRYFSVGLGAGWSMLNSDPGRGLYLEDSGGGPDLEFQDVQGAMAVVQEARLGSRDGVNLTVRNTFLLVPRYDTIYDEDGCEGYEDYYYYSDCYTVEEDGQEFAFGGIAMRIAVPTSARTDLVVDWGTGDAGATWVQGGVAAWLRGNGDAESLGIEVAAGYGSLTGRPDDQYVQLYGPLVSVAGRYRY